MIKMSFKMSNAICSVCTHLSGSHANLLAQKRVLTHGKVVLCHNTAENNLKFLLRTSKKYSVSTVEFKLTLNLNAMGQVFSCCSVNIDCVIL